MSSATADADAGAGSASPGVSGSRSVSLAGGVPAEPVATFMPRAIADWRGAWPEPEEVKSALASLKVEPGWDVSVHYRVTDSGSGATLVDSYAVNRATPRTFRLETRMLPTVLGSALAGLQEGVRRDVDVVIAPDMGVVGKPSVARESKVAAQVRAREAARQERRQRRAAYQAAYDAAKAEGRLRPAGSRQAAGPGKSGSGGAAEGGDGGDFVQLSLDEWLALQSSDDDAKGAHDPLAATPAAASPTPASEPAGAAGKTGYSLRSLFPRPAPTDAALSAEAGAGAALGTAVPGVLPFPPDGRSVRLSLWPALVSDGKNVDEKGLVKKQILREAPHVMRPNDGSRVAINLRILSTAPARFPRSVVASRTASSAPAAAASRGVDVDVDGIEDADATLLYHRWAGPAPPAEAPSAEPAAASVSPLAQSLELVVGEDWPYLPGDGLEAALLTMSQGELARVWLAPSRQLGFPAAVAAALGLSPQQHALYLEVELLRVSKARDRWEMTYPDRLQAMERLKSRGNGLFSRAGGERDKARAADDVARAERFYERALGMLQHDAHLSGEERERANVLRGTLFANMASCRITLGDDKGAAAATDEALKACPTHAKSLLRRAQWRLRRGELAEARSDVVAGLVAHPGNAGLAAVGDAVDKAEARAARAERNAFGGVFAGAQAGAGGEEGAG